MLCKLLGKKHIKGVSKKTGKNIDTILCNISYVDSQTVGEAVKTIFISPKLAEYDSLNIGGTYDIQCDFVGHITGFTYLK